ncbi:ATP-binding protein [Elusimicrobiota bacterium]
MPSQDEIGISQPAQAPVAHSDKTGHRGLWRFYVSVTLLVAIVPLVIMAAINYSHDRQAYRAESRLAVKRILSVTKRSLDLALEERRGALSLVLSETPYRELSSSAVLARTLKRLQSAFGGFVDIGLIDSKGIQRFYSGPYELKGKNYKKQRWFHEVLHRGIYVSEVFTGYRGFPHFVIAFRHRKENNDFFILRATLDMGIIDNRIYNLELDRETDAFIINHDGILQTASAFYGPALKKADVDIPAHSRKTEIVEERSEKGVMMTSGYAYVEKTPFIVMVNKRQQDPFQIWLSHRSTMFWFLIVSIALIFVVVMFSSRRMVRRLREVDAQRAKELHDLEYTNKLATVGRMAASVAHEINNPLAIINEHAGLMKDMVTFSESYPDREKILGLIGTVEKSVERCSDITHRLLGFAKRMDIRKEPISLDRLLKEVVSFQKNDVLHRNIEIKYVFPDDVAPIESDRGKLQQVFLNIFSNALAAVDDGGRIVMRIARIDGGRVTVVISDNGKGMSEEDLMHIYEPFYSTKGEFGTGLGLSITRDIVAKLSGTIDVQSRLGKGTSFKVTLPVKSQEHKE